jgi:hypothetical protein
MIEPVFIGQSLYRSERIGQARPNAPVQSAPDADGDARRRSAARIGGARRGCAAGTDPRGLPPRIPGGGNLFTDFAGGGYFYLDDHDRAVIPTTTRHIFVVRQAAPASRSSATTT